MIKNNSNDNKPTNKPTNKPETEPEEGPVDKPRASCPTAGSLCTIVSTEPEYKKRVFKTPKRHLDDTKKYYQKNKIKACAHVLDLYHTKYKLDPDFKAKKSAYMKARYEREKKRRKKMKQTKMKQTKKQKKKQKKMKQKKKQTKMKQKK